MNYYFANTIKYGTVLSVSNSCNIPVFKVSYRTTVLAVSTGMSTGNVILIRNVFSERIHKNITLMIYPRWCTRGIVIQDAHVPRTT
jgi:hypothetical protein